MTSSALACPNVSSLHKRNAELTKLGWCSISIISEFLTEQEVTEIILAKVSGLCHLSSHSRGFLGPCLWIYLAHMTPSYDTKNASESRL
jgi:hypothetical protein